MGKIALCAVALALGGVSNAALAQYGGRLDLSPSTAEAGDEITVRGAGFAPLTFVQITFDQPANVLGGARSDESGAFSTTVRIPIDATPGEHTVRAAGDDPGGDQLTLDAAIFVVGPETRAGGRTALVLIVVAAAVVLGGGLLALQRFRVVR